MRKTLVPLTLAAMLTLTTLVAVSPAASAVASDTTTSVAITPYDTPIRPLSGLVSIPLTVKYTYTAGVATVPTAIALTVSEAPPWAIVTISPSTVYVNPVQTSSPQSSAGVGVEGTPSVQPKLIVATTADAPAFTPGTIKVTASAATNGDLKPSTGTDQTSITADFFSIIDASAATTIQIARPQKQVVYPITVTNFGNANTKTFYEIVSKPNEDWQVQEPIPITLEARQQGGKQTTATVNLNVLTPYHNGYLNEVGAITMRITSNYALDSKAKGDTTQVSVLTTTKGFYVPGFELALASLAIVGVALAFRRRN